MKKLFLFPRKFRTLGLIMMMPSIALWIANAYCHFSFSFLAYRTNGSLINDGNYTDDLAYLLIMISLCLIAFSKTKIEDEMTIQLRFQSFQISIYFALILFVGLDLFTFDLTYVFYSTLLWYVFLIIFIIVFYTKIYLLTKSAGNEK